MHSNTSNRTKRKLSSTSQIINNSSKTVKKPRISTQIQQLSTRKVTRPSKGTPKPRPKPKPKSTPKPKCSEKSICNSHWCKEPMFNTFEQFKLELLEYTDIVTVGPAGFKPVHDGHLSLIEKAFIEGEKIKDKDEKKKVLVLINTSCAERKRLGEFEIKRGKMFDLWNEFISPTLEDYKKLYGIDYQTSFNNDSTLRWLSRLEVDEDGEVVKVVGEKKIKIVPNIYSIYSDDNIGQLIGIFGPYTETTLATETTPASPSTFGKVIAIKFHRVSDGKSGTKAREFLDKDTLEGLEEFKAITTEIRENLRKGYFEALKSGGARKRKRKTKKTKKKYYSVKRK